MYENKLMEKLKSIYWPGILLESSNVVAHKIIIVLCTLLIASNGTTIKEELISFASMNDLSLNGELVSVESLNNGINLILFSSIFYLSAFLTVFLVIRMQGDLNMKMNGPIKVSLILIIVSWLVSISYQGAESKLMIGVAICLLIMISVKVNTVILWRKYLKPIVRADTIWDLPERLENITEEISDDRVTLYACLFRSYLPDNGVIILESLQRNESLSCQWLEVTYRLKNSKRRFNKVIDIPDESPSN
ncbi:hypothetical protein ABG980_02875 [Enterococcus casseliflavus]|uniref:hypothetical protein n=1 Tax=Enterococcus casseliflavus TaxID=37734 RepID=UPI00232E9D14|nr:hypothetical protein [Enterococcus casseliflavus]MDB1696131.1 hypothetical protein [Enterococcus casseliflavus]MDB1699774.1 hypothetical protein [Enterococcus casseliflavus]MDB1702323.1 hypothetical protein [Enterococcus casseliflavus]MDB1704615.1 hypothetical protein [Enterococcus casseliflavus]